MTITTFVFDAYGTLFDVSAAARELAAEPGREEFAEHWTTVADIWRRKQLEYTWIHAIVGENGAGKSTLMKVLSGVHPADSYQGDIIYEGDVQAFHGIRDSEDKGIIIIHQELALVPQLHSSR